MQASDAIPRVVLLGRLSLYGHRAERLHEELVPLTARWIEPSQRQGPLRAYARDAEQRTLDLLDDTLTSRTGHQPDPVIRDRLIQTAARDIDELLPQLEPRANELAALATRRLQERGDQEAKELRETLERQLGRVVGEIEKHDESRVRQLTFEFSDDDKRQLEANMRSWRIRREQFERDLEHEPSRIREFYEVRATRVEPIGLVYLWPESN